MRTYKVSYRIVSDLFPNVASTMSYTVDARWDGAAENLTRQIMQDEVTHLFGRYNEEWLKRTTTIRVK